MQQSKAIKTGRKLRAADMIMPDLNAFGILQTAPIKSE